MSKQNHKREFVAGAIFGTLLGGLAALLLAPKSGKETQEKLRGHAKRVMKTADVRLSQMEAELNEHIESLKLAARDLRGEAYEESQRLITRAEILKNDLQDSAANLATKGRNMRDIKEDVSADAKRLVSEGQAVLSDLEQMTKKIIASATGNSRDDEDDQR